MLDFLKKKKKKEVVVFTLYDLLHGLCLSESLLWPFFGTQA